MAIAGNVHGAQTGASSPLMPVRLGFSGQTRDYWRLVLRGALLQVVTLGIYRFWLYTDMRRFLWASTRVEDDTPEYAGTAAELLIGFLIAIGILVPIYALFFLGSLELGLVSQLSGVAAFVVLAGLGEYAAYRARRYRLTRTVFRGLRFHQTGSAAGYAVRAMLWWIAVVPTLGLAWPWAMASLERYKMRNTFYGHLGGGFAGSGTRLFRQGVLIWLLAVGPLAAGLAAGAIFIDWAAVADALKDSRSNDWFNLVVLVAVASGDSTTLGVEVILGGIVVSTLVGALVYPVYQAIAMRWWLGGLRLGGAAAASALRIGRYYGVYLRYVLYLALFTAVFGAVVFGLPLIAGINLMSGELESDDASTFFSVATMGAAIVAYVIYLLGASTIYHVVLKMRLWQAAAESMLITGYATLGHVRADAAESTAVGEGLADALGGGGV
jgi:uncharacterized membrane protein YjgN (DUF898 family)